MTRMLKENIIPGNPDSILQYRREHQRDTSIVSVIKRKAYSCVTRPETLPCNFEEYYDEHIELIKYRIKGLEIKAIELLISQVILETYKFEMSQDDENWWRECRDYGGVLTYSDKSIKIFYDSFFENSEYRKVLERAINIFKMYSERFPEYFI